MKKTNLLPIIVLIFVFVVETESNFEDARCRCTCPSTEYFYSGNKTGSAEFKRRYYTSTEIKIPSSCNTQMVVKNLVINRVDESRLDAFLANCNCKFELRNSVLLKVVVIFVICIIFLLSSYMAYLLVIEPVILKRRRPLSFVPYERHRTDDVGAHSFHTFWFRPITNRFTRLRESRSLLPSSSSSSCSLLDEEGQSGERDMEDNIFANPSTPNIEDLNTTTFNVFADTSRDEVQVRTRNNHNNNFVCPSFEGSTRILDRVVDKVFAETEKWKTKVEEQRKHVLDREMLN